MNKAIIKLYVDEEDLTKQLEVLFGNDYSYVIVKKEEIAKQIAGGYSFKTQYYVEAHIGEPNEPKAIPISFLENCDIVGMTIAELMRDSNINLMYGGDIVNWILEEFREKYESNISD